VGRSAGLRVIRHRPEDWDGGGLRYGVVGWALVEGDEPSGGVVAGQEGRHGGGMALLAGAGEDVVVGDGGGARVVVVWLVTAVGDGLLEVAVFFRSVFAFG
jgi:hypothetical protein